MSIPSEVALQARPLSQWLWASAQAFPERSALEGPDGALTYRALAAAVRQQADALTAAGIGPGDRVAVAATRSTPTIVAILAVVQAGAAYVPLDMAYPAERLQAMLADSAPRAVLGEPAALQRLGELIPDLPTLERPAAGGTAVFGAEPDLTYVLFTSGSTGRPKGVAMGAAPLCGLIAWHAAHPRLGLPARTLQFAPLSFDVHCQEIYATLACGGTLVVLPEDVRRDPQRLHAALIEQRIERIFLPYVALQMIAEASRDAVPAALRDVVSAGEQLQITPAIRALFSRLPGAELHNHYGPTETHVVTAHELRGDAATWPEIPPIGRALPHVRLALRGADPAQPDTGELLLGGNTLAHGYLARPDLTAERFLASVPGLEGRWYATGDLVRRDADGVHTYLGRADQQLKVDGFRIEPGEIELALMAHPDVKDAVVTAPEVPGAGRQLVAHLVLRQPHADGRAIAHRLREHLRGRLPEYMVPVRFEVLERLPTTPSGKIDRLALPLPQLQALPTGGKPIDVARALWQELLGLDTIGDDENLFDLGARSLLVLRFVARFRELGQGALSVADVYDRPTLGGLDAALRGAPVARRAAPRRPSATAGIAIVGMASRTPGAADVEAFWANLVAGREGIRHFSRDELDPSIPDDIRNRPNFVAARGVLEDAGRFDAAFFGVSAREATLLDPQQRLMLELCWTALEHAAIDPTRTPDRIGVYAGSGNNTYAPALRQEQPELVQQAGEFAVMLASEKDYVATRVANRLNLTGPAVSVHTACSTGLVAVVQAWHALASGLCDVALAGGATVVVPQEGGYLHIEGAMESADGHCRPFDAAATGTVFASGGGVVVLKRLEDAVAAGDTVYAVIRGVGLNNDGGEKASFTAPSVTGQAGAIRMALDHAGVDARSIGYVEAHGTGTALGDPIEIAALTRAWREDTADSCYCGIGSLKGNLGHMVAAAGVVGLIKAALSLHRELIPGTLHYRQPNPQIDFAASPFRVIAANTPWPRGGAPRRAGVSSFGVGGTNAHVVVEEAPAEASEATDSAAPARRLVLPLSARTAADVLRRAQDLARQLESQPQLALDRVAATLMFGRKPMAQRLAVVARDATEAAAALRKLKSASAALTRPRVVFMFPGQGSQHPGMARGLYDEAPAFREALDRCLVAARSHGVDLRAALLDAAPSDAAAGEHLAQTRHAQPALFSMSYALAALLDSVGVHADAMIGHSIGEYAAACHAGVFTLDDAMAAVVARGLAMFEQPAGAMLAVRADLATVQARLPAGVEVAGVNAPALTVVAGGFDAIDAFAAQLEAGDIGTTRLKVSHAFHSASMDAALPKVAEALQRATLRAPAVPVYSCISGAPLLPGEATDAQYWARQVRATVQFHRAVVAELAHADTVFVEVGPGQALTALLRQHRNAAGTVPRVVPLLGTAQDPGDAALNALGALGQLWCAGIEVAWPIPATVHRLALPTYPFGGENHWFRRRAAAVAATAVAPTLAAVALPVPPPVPAIPEPIFEVPVPMSRLPRLEAELKRILSDVSGIAAEDLTLDASFVDQGLDSLSMTQATLELERVFGVKLRFRRLQEDLSSIDALARFLDAQLPADRFAPPPPPVAAVAPVAAAPMSAAVPVAVPIAMAAPAPAVSPAPWPVAAGSPFLQQLIQQQMQLMSQHLTLLSGQGALAPGLAAAALPAPVAAPAVHAAAVPADVAPAPATAAPAAAESAEPSKQSLVEKPFGASPRLTLQAKQDFTPAQRRWVDDFTARYIARSGKSRAFSQEHRKVMADPRVVTGFNPLWKDLVYPIVVDRSKGASLWDLDGNEYIDLLSCFGGNLLGYQPDDVVVAMQTQLQLGLEVGPQHPMAADVARLISEFTGMERVAFCNTGSEAVMGAMRVARTVTGRKTIAIFSNSYHGIFDEVIVRGTRQLRSLSAAPGILANAVENILVLDWNSEESLRVLRERGSELAAIMTEPIQNKYPTVQPREFVHALRQIADQAGCALIFDEVVTGFRVAPGGAQEFYGVRADLATYGKVIGGGLPFAAIAGNANWLDALDGGHWQYGDDSYPEAGVTYFAGTFVRHPLALAAARATLLHIQRGGREFYRQLNDRTQRLIDRLNTAFAVRGAPVKAVHCASIWRLQWDDNQRYLSLFYYLVRFHGLHLYEQFGHFVTEAMTDAHTDRIFQVFTDALDELMALGFIAARDGTPPPSGDDRKSRRLPNEAPLTPGQTERWLAGGFDPQARRALNESFCVSLQGGVDRTALRAALQDVLSRHEAFRIKFDLDEPRQLLTPVGPVPVAEIDLSGQADSDGALDAFCTEASARDFPIDEAPLAAVSLLTLADGRVVVHVVASHLVFDGWASSVFNAELATAYKARSIGMAPNFKPAESPLNFAVEEQVRFEGAEGKEALAFWQKLLQNPPAPLNLGDRTPPTPRAYAADTQRVRLEGEAFSRLRAQARQSGATLFQVLLTAVTVMLQRRSGQNDFVVSIPYASQGLQRRGPLMGDGVLDLPLRLGCTPQETFAEVLQRVRSHLMDALEHPLMTQGTVARALGIRSAGDRPPLTGIYFNLNPKVDLSAYSPLVATMHEGRKRGTLSELFFNFYEQEDALTLDLHYSSEFFGPERAQELIDALMAQCIGFGDTLAQPVAATVSAAELAAAAVTAAKPAAPSAPGLEPRVVAWNAATVSSLEKNARVEQWVSRQATATPNAVALVAQGVTLTYAELEARANRFANLLKSRGIGAGMLVGVCLTRGPDLVPSLLGILKTGAAYVPLDPGFPKDRLHYMAEDAGVRLVITDSTNAGLCGVSRGLQLRIDDDAATIAAASDTAVPSEAAWPYDATMYVIYTSGSTGKPKGVVLPQNAVCNFLASMRHEPGLKASDRLLAVTTLSFDIAVLELFLPLTTGARIVLAQREEAMDGEVLARLAKDQGINVMQATPTTWHMLLDANWRAPAGFRALCGGEPLPPSLAERMLDAGVELWNMYGPTETTVWSTLCRITDAKQKITIGRPIANTQVWVLDEHLKPVAIGQEGELCIGGAGVATGYFKRPELTAEKFIADPFDTKTPGARIYRTGDLSRWREDGTIEHLGRLDFQVKIRGYRIELGEIEARLAALPGVARTVVTAREDSPGDVRLVGYFVPQPGANPDVGGLREGLRVDLPDYMLPQYLVSLDAMPLLPNGKIDRKALPAPAQPVVPANVAVSLQVADDPVENEIAQQMAIVLGLPRVARTDNFFELGGHSLRAAKLAAKLRETLNQHVSLRTIFEAPTVASLGLRLRHAAGIAEASPASPIHRRSGQGEAPLSLMQQRLWFLEGLDPGGTVNNLPSAHRLRGPLNIAAMEHAFNILVQRQSSLRTVFQRTGEGVVQKVCEVTPVVLSPVVDLSNLDAEHQRRETLQQIDGLVRTPFNLEAGPLFVVRLYKLSPTDHVLFFMTHHIIWDGWSFDILYSELSQLYVSCCEETPNSLPPLSVSYGDFSAWLDTWMQGDELQRQTEHWRRKLSPLSPALELPVDHPRPAEMSGNGASLYLHLSMEESAALHLLAKKLSTTVFVILLSSYALLLHRYSDQDDFVIGTPVKGRAQPEVQNVMGFFVNALPLRMTVSRELTFAKWVAHVHSVVIDAFAFPDVPFEHLVRALNAPRDLSRAMLFQSLFSFQDVRDRPTTWGDLQHSRYDIPLYGAMHDLSLWSVETPRGIECVFTYNTDIFNEASIGGLASTYRFVLAQIARDSSSAISELSWLQQSEQSRLVSWNETRAQYETGDVIHEMLQRQARRTPEAVALLQPGQGQLTYSDTDRRSNQLAHLLRSRGIGRGSLVGLCVDRGLEMVIAQIAILKAGAAYVPLDPAYPVERLAYMAENARLAILITESTLVSALDWPRASTILLDTDAVTIVNQAFTPLATDKLCDARPEDPAYVIYTSGSTGKPKGVVVPHRAVTNFLTSMAREPGLRSTDRLVAVTTLSFDIAVLELLLPLSVGAQVILAGREQALDGRALSQLIETTGANVMQGTPATWRMLIDAGWHGSSEFRALIGGEGLPMDLAEQLLSRTGELWNMYGPTETTVWSTCWRVESPRQFGVSIGRPIANTTVWILDDRQRLCPIGVPGEIYIGGDGVTTGYLHRQELTAERFIADVFSDENGSSSAMLYRTGDRGRWRQDGLLEHMGRLDFQVKVRGFRIELGEIESCLATHSDIARVLVVVREEHAGDARLVAYVVPKASMPEANVLRDHLRASLPDYMIPQHFVRLESIPLLPNGKVNRQQLPIPTNDSVGLRTTFVAPSTQSEVAIAEVWKQLLGVEHIGVHDNFFDLGGHSLLAMQAIGRLEQRLGVRVPVRRFIFEALGQIASGIDVPSARVTTAVDGIPMARGGVLTRLARLVRRA